MNATLMSASAGDSPSSGLSEADIGMLGGQDIGFEDSTQLSDYPPPAPALDTTAQEAFSNSTAADDAKKPIEGEAYNFSASGTRMEFSSVPGQYLLLDQVWLESEFPEFAIPEASVERIQVNGRDAFAVPLAGEKATIDSFNTSGGPQFSHGSRSTVWIGRPMTVEILELPHREVTTVTHTGNGSTDIGSHSTPIQRLTIRFTDADSNGQAVALHKRWLHDLGFGSVRGQAEDGTPIPRSENATHILFGAAHFSTLTFSEGWESAGWTYTEQGGSTFTNGAFGGRQTSIKRTGNYSAYVKFDPAITPPNGQDYGDAYLSKSYSFMTSASEKASKVHRLRTWFYVNNYSHNGDAANDRMKAMVKINLLSNYETQTVYDTYSYILSSYYGTSDNWTGSLGAKEKLIYGKPPLQTWIKFDGYLNLDWPNIDWNQAEGIKVQLWVYASGTKHDSFQMNWDDLEITYAPGVVAYQYESAAYAGNQTEQFLIDVPSVATRVEVQLTMPAGSNFDLSVWDPSGRRTGGLTKTNNVSDNSIPSGVYGGTSANPEWFEVVPTETGYWKTMVYAVTGEGLFTLKFRIYTSEGLTTTGTRETIKHKFDLSTKVYSVNASLRMATGADFDLSLWEDTSTRCGGYALGDTGQSFKNQTVNCRYSGRTANPEWVSVAGIPSTGDWYVSAYDNSGNGGFVINVTIHPDADGDGLSDVYEFTKVYKLYFGPGPDQLSQPVAVPKKPSYANQSYELFGRGHFMSASASLQIQRTAGPSMPVDAKVGYWNNKTSAWDYTTNSSGWTPVRGSWARYNSSGEWMYKQDDTTGSNKGNTNSYASIWQVGKGTYHWKCKFVAGSTPSCGMYFFATSGTGTHLGNSFLVFQNTTTIKVFRSSANSLTEKASASVSVSNGQSFDYRVEYNSLNGTLLVYRNTSENYLIKWTAPMGDRYYEGKYIALRTSIAEVHFDNVSATVEGWYNRSLPLPDSGSQTKAFNMISLGFEKELFMQSNVWRVMIAKNVSTNYTNLTYFQGELNVTTDIYNADSDFDALADGAEAKSEYYPGSGRTHWFSVPITAKYNVSATFGITSCVPPCTQNYPRIEVWIDYQTSARKLLWGATATGLSPTMPTVSTQLARGVHSVTTVEMGGSLSSWSWSVKKSTLTALKPPSCQECKFDPGASPVRPDIDSDNVLDGVEDYSHEYRDNREAWRQTAPASKPSARYYPGTAYDEESDRTILFGGTNSVADTWAYDANTDQWLNMNPPSPPSYRYGHSMAYSKKQDNIVMFGGLGPYYFDDTWTYDLNTNVWTNKNPATKPSGRYMARMVYDSQSDRFVLFGGSAGSVGTLSNETWVYDLGNNTWTNKNPGGSKPSARENFALSYHQMNDTAVLFGGYDGTTKGDTWAYNLESNSWTNRNPSTPPPAMWASRMTYDVKSDRSVLYSGVDTGSSYVGETFTYDYAANAWLQKVLPTKPSQRAAVAIEYDAESDLVVMFGGALPTGGTTDETWHYDDDVSLGTPWASLSPSTPPPARREQGMSYDRQSDLVVMFGGFKSGAETDETWVYNFNVNAWANKNPGTKPTGRRSFAMDYSTKNDRVVQFGGHTGAAYSSQTWAYDVNTNSWTNKSPASPPAGRYAHSWAYDVKSDRFVMFGGYTGSYQGDTWVYDLGNNTWTQKTPSPAPSARISHRMAYDTSSARVILFGGLDSGSNYKNDIWAYNLNDGAQGKWTQLSPSSSPSARRDSGIAYDALSDRVLLHGGYTSAGVNGETWEFDYDSVKWTQRTETPSPAARYLQAMACDEESDRCVLYGGYISADQGDTWSYDQKTGTSSYTIPYARLITLPAGLFNVTVRFRSGTGNAKVNITLDGSVLGDRNVTSNADLISSFRPSIGSGSHWLKVAGANLTKVFYVKFEKIETDPETKDTEKDGLPDDEPYVHGTLPTSKDSDLDGLWDGTEVQGYNITVNGQTTGTDSSPTLADTDSDGITDWNEYGKFANYSFSTPEQAAAFTSSSGNWQWQKEGTNGVLQNIDATSGNTNAWALVDQGGALTFEYRMKFTSILYSYSGAGMHVFASDGPQASGQRGSSYLVYQDSTSVHLYDSKDDVLTHRASVGLSAVQGTYYRYKVVYNATNSTLAVWRNGSFATSWTDGVSPLRMGAFISLRTNAVKAVYDYVYVNTSGATNPKSNDTDADGLYDWNDLSGWNPVNGTWEWRDNVYQQTSASGAANTNSYAAVAQSGETTYEWKQKMTAATGWAGLHVFSDNGAAGNRGNSYLVALKASAAPTSDKIEICKTTANALSCKQNFSLNELGTGIWNKIKVVYSASNYSVNVWRNGSWVGKWTDTASGTLQAGNSISLRTNASNSQFDDLYVNSSGSTLASWNAHRFWAERVSGSYRLTNDTDGEGLGDGLEISGWWIERWVSGVKSTIRVASSPLVGNSDGDGWNDKTEYLRSTDPRNTDTDQDGTADSSETTTPFGTADNDYDGLADSTETGGWPVQMKRENNTWSNYTASSNNLDLDTNDNGFYDGEEYRRTYRQLGPDPCDIDPKCSGDPGNGDPDGDGWSAFAYSRIVTITLLSYEVVFDGNPFGGMDQFIAMSLPGTGLTWRAPAKGVVWHKNTGDVVLLSSRYTYQFVSDSRWSAASRTLQFQNYHIAGGDRVRIGTANYYLPIGTPGTSDTTLTMSSGPCPPIGCYNNKIKIRVSDAYFIDRNPGNGAADDDKDGIQEAAENRYHSSPYHTKDIFTEVDWAGLGTDHNYYQLGHEAKWRIGDVYIARGIHLHIDDGVGCSYGGLMCGGQHIHSMPYYMWFKRKSGNDNDFWDVKWGNNWDVTNIGRVDDPGDNLNGNFHKSRKNIFRYVLFSGGYLYGSSFAGIGDPGGDDVWISDKSNRKLSGQAYWRTQAEIFVHEIGHNLGLDHFGDVKLPEASPLYYSIMSYYYLRYPERWPAEWGDSPNYGWKDKEVNCNRNWCTIVRWWDWDYMKPQNVMNLHPMWEEGYP